MLVDAETLRCVRTATAGPGFLVTHNQSPPSNVPPIQALIPYPNVSDPIVVGTDAEGPAAHFWEYSAPIARAYGVGFYRARPRLLWTVLTASAGGFPFVTIEASVDLVGSFGTVPLGIAGPVPSRPVYVLPVGPFDETFPPIDPELGIPAIQGAQLRLRFTPVVVVASGITGSFAVLDLIQLVTAAGSTFVSGVEIDTGTFPYSGS